MKGGATADQREVMVGGQCGKWFLKIVPFTLEGGPFAGLISTENGTECSLSNAVALESKVKSPDLVIRFYL